MRRLNKELLKNNIEKRAAGDLAEGNIGGAYCRVIQDGEILYESGIGERVIGSGDIVTDKTVFRLASMTKPITAVGALILYERGLLDLDDKVSKYIPAFSDVQVAELDENEKIIGAHKAETEVTIRHILSHSSGIGTGAAGMTAEGGKKAEEAATLSEAVDGFSRAYLAFEPGSATMYSPLGAFDVLARIIEIVSGMEYEDFLKKEIFDPCKMVDTTFLPGDEQWSRMIDVHNKVDGKAINGGNTPECVFFHIPTTHKLGGAGLISTTADYTNFAMMLLGGGEIFGKRILKEETVKEMSTRQLTPDVNCQWDVWGLGVRVIVREDYERLPVGAFGWSGAYGTHFWVDPVNKVTAFYMKNSYYDGGSGAVTSANFETDVFNSFE